MGKRARLELHEMLMEAIEMKPMMIRGREYTAPNIFCKPIFAIKATQHLQGKGTRRKGQRRGSKPWDRR